MSDNVWGTYEPEAGAVESAKKIGLNQIREVKKEVFSELPQFYEMFRERLKILKSIGMISIFALVHLICQCYNMEVID